MYAIASQYNAVAWTSIAVVACFPLSSLQSLNSRLYSVYCVQLVGGLLGSQKLARLLPCFPSNFPAGPQVSLLELLGDVSSAFECPRDGLTLKETHTAL